MACDVRSHTYFFYSPCRTGRPASGRQQFWIQRATRIQTCTLLSARTTFCFLKIMCHGKCKHCSVPSFRRAFFFCIVSSCIFLLMFLALLLASFTPKQFRPTQVSFLRALRPGFADLPASFTPRLCDLPASFTPRLRGAFLLGEILAWFYSMCLTSSSTDVVDGIAKSRVTTAWCVASVVQNSIR